MCMFLNGKDFLMNNPYLNMEVIIKFNTLCVFEREIKFMIQRRVAITEVAGYVPDYIMTNKELETYVDTNDEWIQTMTGIKERRILKGEGKATSDMGVEVVKMLLEKSGISKDEIDLVICGTVTADMNFPDTANVIRDKMGITSGFGFDINAACSGFLYALEAGTAFVKGGLNKVIVIGADMMSSIVNYQDRSTCIIFGDGAGAVLLEPSKDDTGIIDSIMRSDGSGRHFLHQKGGGSLRPASHETVDNREHFVFQEGRTVFKHAIAGMVGAVKDIMAKNNLTNDDIAWIVPHQANIRIINVVASQLKFPIEKVMINIEKYGNTTAGTLPLCLWEYQPKLKKGDKIILTAFGGGFTWGATLIEWS